MDKVTVKAAREDGRVAFFEQHPDHEGGEVFVFGNGDTVTAAETRALKEAIRSGRLVATQETPTTEQTPPTETRATETPPTETRESGPFAGLGLTADQEQALRDAGYADRAALQAASDDDLIALPTIGKATTANLRKALR